MAIIKDLLLIGVGIAILIYSSDTLIKWAVSIAQKLGISPLMIGLTIVAFGTSAPELAINLISAFASHTELALSNVLGSNIANTLLILGLTALIYPINVKKGLVRKEIPFNFVITIILALLILDKRAWYPSNIITRLDAGVLLSLFSIYFMYLIYQFLKEWNHSSSKPTNTYSLPISLILIVLGVIGLTIGGKMIVNWASHLAQLLSIPSEVIWATIIAIGTSLPELAVAITAALKKQADIAIGNIIGSNIFNILWILGVTWVVYPLPAYNMIEIDLAIALLGALLIFAFSFWFGRFKITRIEWAVLLIIYLWYIGFLVAKSLGYFS